MTKIFHILRRLFVGTNWTTVWVNLPTELNDGQTVEGVWVRRRINPVTLDYEYSVASEKEAEEASWMWAIK